MAAFLRGGRRCSASSASLTASAGAAFLLAQGIRVVSDPASLASPAHLAHLALIALSPGVAVALIEETVMRGALHSAIAREAGEGAALWLIAPLFAVLHFFAKTHIDAPGLDERLRLAVALVRAARESRAACSIRCSRGWP